MERLLEGKIALVTGSSRGIGKAIAQKFTENGATVVINSTQNSSNQAHETLEELKQINPQTHLITGDISDETFSKELISQTINRFNRLDILVNNAGITQDTLLVRMNYENWKKVIDINLNGLFLVTKPAILNMIKQRTGSIIFISSISAHGNPGQINYASSKGGMESFMKTIALEYAQRGIRSNAIACGPVDTEMVAKLNQEQKAKLISLVPQKRLITPHEIANTALFLASDLSSAITGQVINVDGGIIT